MKSSLDDFDGDTIATAQEYLKNSGVLLAVCNALESATAIHTAAAEARDDDEFEGRFSELSQSAPSYESGQIVQALFETLLSKDFSAMFASSPAFQPAAYQRRMKRFTLMHGLLRPRGPKKQRAPETKG